MNCLLSVNEVILQSVTFVIFSIYRLFNSMQFYLKDFSSLIYVLIVIFQAALLSCNSTTLSPKNFHNGYNYFIFLHVVIEYLIHYQFSLGNKIWLKVQIYSSQRHNSIFSPIFFIEIYFSTLSSFQICQDFFLNSLFY